jgi:hypothetical protein
MARSFPSTDIAMTMLRDLMAAEALADSLAATAPAAVAEAGGAQALVAKPRIGPILATVSPEGSSVQPSNKMKNWPWSN